jgi:hypothetical protein
MMTILMIAPPSPSDAREFISFPSDRRGRPSNSPNRAGHREPREWAKLLFVSEGTARRRSVLPSFLVSPFTALTAPTVDLWEGGGGRGAGQLKETVQTPHDKRKGNAGVCPDQVGRVPSISERH